MVLSGIPKKSTKFRPKENMVKLKGMQYETNVGLQVTYGLHVMTQRHYEELTSGVLCYTEFVLSGIASGTGSTLVIDSDGIVKRSSSSKRYKDHICSYTKEEAEALLSLPVVRFKYKD